MLSLAHRSGGIHAVKAIVQQPFGRTGHQSSRIILGAAAFGNVTQAEADATLDLALTFGVNHVDTAAGYGESEVRIGAWIKRHGQPFFLATKTGERTAAKAREQLHRSLERLGVARMDLVQMHCLIDPQEWETALGPGGALEALIEARQQGLIRFIGVTGHGLTVARMHRRSLERFGFDSVLLPYSFVLAQNAQYLAEFNELLALCQARKVAVQTIKSLAQAPWGDGPHTAATWYKPLEAQPDVDRAVHWVLGRPGIFLNSAGDIHVIPKVLDAASRFETAPSDADMQAQVARLGMAPLFA
jgi:aryl-alcohol dehydrogenase-like predicted oxidoreductase